LKRNPALRRQKLLEQLKEQSEALLDDPMGVAVPEIDDPLHP
jgi:hypothetical protein